MEQTDGTFSLQIEAQRWSQDENPLIVLICCRFKIWFFFLNDISWINFFLFSFLKKLDFEFKEYIWIKKNIFQCAQPIYCLACVYKLWIKTSQKYNLHKKKTSERFCELHSFGVEIRTKFCVLLTLPFIAKIIWNLCSQIHWYQVLFLQTSQKQNKLEIISV